MEPNMMSAQWVDRALAGQDPWEILARYTTQFEPRLRVVITFIREDQVEAQLTKPRFGRNDHMLEAGLSLYGDPSPLEYAIKRLALRIRIGYLLDGSD